MHIKSGVMEHLIVQIMDTSVLQKLKAIEYNQLIRLRFIIACNLFNYFITQISSIYTRIL
jgi:hypothetical protein